MAAKITPLIFLTFSFCVTIFALPEQGVWNLNISEPQILPFQKSMYNGTNISVKLICSNTGPDDSPPPVVRLTWLLRWTPCAEEYMKVEVDADARQAYINNPDMDLYGLGYKSVEYQQSVITFITCDGSPVQIPDESAIPPKKTRTPSISAILGNKTVTQPMAKKEIPASKVAKNVEAPKGDAKVVKKEEKGKSRRLKRAAPTKDVGKVTTTPNPTAGKLKPETIHENDQHVVARTWRDGIYVFLMDFKTTDVDAKFTIEVDVKMKAPHGYLSAIEYPLLPFYGTMCVVYIISGLGWLILSACNWRDLLRIQFWIGGVIFLGMLEKAVFFGEYSSINFTGKSVRGAVIFAEVVSCLKRTLARMLVVIVSLGFGIVKPRLGPMLHRVLGMGALYFILGSVEACLRALRAKGDVNNQALLANIPLAVLDAAICWWVFTSLVQTTRTLRLRRNLVKLGLYRHFTNTLIFAVLASIAFMIWSIKQHKLTTCLTDWKEIWVDDAFWHLLFSVILFVIMILWRPNINNQRYAFSPLLDAADEEDEAEEPMMNDAFEGMKMRGSNNSRSNSPKPRENKAEDDLKWIEENIPASVTDTALPSLLDSDEEIMTTKFEMSKME